MPSLNPKADDLPFSNPDRGWGRSLALAALLHGGLIGGALLVTGWGSGDATAVAPPEVQELAAEMVIVPVLLTAKASVQTAPDPAPPEPAKEVRPDPLTEVPVRAQSVPEPEPEPETRTEPVAEPNPPRPKPQPVAKPVVRSPSPAVQVTAQPSARPVSLAASSAPSTPPQAPAPQESGPSAGVVRNWHQLLATHLERHKTYPRQAQMLRQQGIVSIRVSVDATGQVLSVALAEGSGSASLDAATLDLARRASPLPPPPAGMETPVSLVIPLRYQLH